jgi:hypothetical protein
MPKLPPYPGTAPSDIEAMLEELAALGWPVYAHSEPNWFVIALSPSIRFEVKREIYAKTWRIVGLESGSTKHFLEAGDAEAIRAALAKAAKVHGFDLSALPTSARLSASAPVGNRMSLVHLAGQAAVQGIFDPYFDDRAIANLGILCNMGLKLAPSIRVLLTSKTVRRLSATQIVDFATEREISLDVRICASDKEHRRFLLMDNGKSLVLGCSLNDLTKNEAAHTEPNGLDLTFFEEQFTNAAQF